MSLHPSELSLVVAELDRELTGAFVQKAYAPLPKLCYLELRKPGRSTLLVLSAEPEVGRVAVAERRIPSPESASHFQRLLRHELMGAQLQRVTQADGDRVATFRFLAKDLIRLVVIELTGPHGNLFLTTEEGRLLALSAPSSSARRELRPGATYEPPQGTVPGGVGESRLLPEPSGAFPHAAAAEALFADREATRHRDQVKRLLLQPARAKVSRVERTIEKVKAELAEGQAADGQRQLGELLSQNQHRLVKGAKEVTLTRYTEAGVEEVSVPLDATRTPKQQVERAFHLYRRLLRKAERAASRLLELERERAAAVAELEATQARAAASLGEQEFALLAEKDKPEPPPERRPFREYRGKRGERIWVGKNADGNEALTFRQAKAHHLWLHARGVPGSHVVLAVERGAEVSDQAVLDAAHLALHHSDLKDEPVGDVQLAPIRQVKKQKGGPAGAVLVLNEKVIHLRKEPDRLSRLLESLQAN